MKAVIIIPARYESSRFPGKPLVEILGKSMILRTWERCVQVLDKDKVHVATDDDRIRDHCETHGIQVVMTSADCHTGTDRVQEASDGFSVILTETGMSRDATSALANMRSPLIAEVLTQQLGEDLLVKVSLTDAARDRTDVRSRQQYNAPRDLYEFVLELVPKDGGGATVKNALAALRSVGLRDVTGCALDYDRSVRNQLDPGALARALAPQGAFTDRYVRAAMRRLGDLTPGGVVEFTDGSKYSPIVPIELEVSLNQASQARGFLALLRTFVYELEQGAYRVETYRSLIAPELDMTTFAGIVEKAEAAASTCGASL